MIEGFKPGLSGRFKPGLKVHQRPACLLLDLSVCGRIPAGFLRAFSGVFLQRCSVTYLMEWEGFSSQDPWQILDTPLVDPWLILDPSSGILWHSLAVSTHLDWFLGLYRFVLQRNRCRPFKLTLLPIYQKSPMQFISKMSAPQCLLLWL